MDTWGMSASFDCKGCDKANIKDVIVLSVWIKELVKRIDMIAYGEPHIVYFGKDDKTGYTLVQLIETSNITAHFCDNNGDGYIDVFSCKPFLLETVEECISEFFNPVSIKTNMIYRQA